MGGTGVAEPSREGSVDAGTRRSDPRQSSRRDPVRFLGVAGTSVGIQAPAGAETFLPAGSVGAVPHRRVAYSYAIRAGFHAAASTDLVRGEARLARPGRRSLDRAGRIP